MNTIADSVKQSSRISTGWGFAVIILGMLAVMTPFVTGVAVTMLLSMLVTAAGLTITIYAFKADSLGKGIFQFLFGGITIVCGIGMFFTPVESMMTLTMFILAYFIIDGVFGVVAGFSVRPADGWGWIVVSGISSIVLGGLLWSEWPLTGAYAVGILLGIRLIFTGWSMAMLGAAGSQLGDDLKEVGDEIRAAAKQ
jgi:uncharacterized membrane protein HdeD (DUF308 family)